METPSRLAKSVTADRSESATLIETPRLLLRATRDADIPLLHAAVFGDPDVMRYLFDGAAMDAAQSASVIRKHFCFDPASAGYAVLVEKPDTVIGYAGLAPCAALGADDLEFGYVLARHVWGRGYAREIARAQLAFGFETLRRERLLGLVDPDNRASIRVLTGLGLRYIRNVALPDRPTRAVYAIDAQDWR